MGYPKMITATEVRNIVNSPIEHALFVIEYEIKAAVREQRTGAAAWLHVTEAQLKFVKARLIAVGFRIATEPSRLRDNQYYASITWHDINWQAADEPKPDPSLYEVDDRKSDD